MSLRILRRLAIPIVLTCANGPAAAGVELRIESRPIFQPIDAYVLVSQGGIPVVDLTKADFTVTLDGAVFEEFEFSLPPSHDPSQKVSIVIVQASGFYSAPYDYAALIAQLDVGDYVSVVKYRGDIEMSRSGGISILPFTQIDGPGSNALSEFLRSPFSNTTSGSGAKFFFDGLLTGLGEFERPPVSLPDGPKAIVTVSTGGGRGLSLSHMIATANAGSIPIFNAGYASLDPSPDYVAHSMALAMNTGGARIPVAVEASADEAITKMASWLKEGYRITIPHDAVTDCNAHVLEVSLGAEATSVPFVRCDTTPERFHFAELRDVAVETMVVSEAAIITGIETATPVTVLGGEYSIGCGSSFTNEPGWILPGESICLRHTTAATGGLEASTLLIVDGESAWFVSHTIFPAPPPTSPPPVSPPASPPPTAGDADNAGGGGPVGIAESLLLIGLLLARYFRSKGFQLTVVAALAVIAGLAAPPARAASGDLDPSFADHGRLDMIPTAGAAWSVEVLDAGGILVAGTGLRRMQAGDWGICAAGTSFVGRLDENGTIDSTYHAANIDSMQALDIARHADGKVVAVGRKYSKYGGFGRCNSLAFSELVVFRLESDGSVDTGFGIDGVFEWSSGGNSNWHEARSVSLDNDGRIVVAGIHRVEAGDQFEYRAVVLRLLNDGSLDPAFADAGVYVGPVIGRFGDTRVVRTGAGNYRMSAGGAEGCAIVGLTANGALDAAFGIAGIASVESPGGNPVTCNSLELIAGDGLFVAGSAAEHGFVARLLANGAPDSTFAADGAIADFMATATSIMLVADGKVFVAGAGPQGALIMRLHAAGTLDTTFGDGGRTWIDLPADSLSTPVIHDMAIREDGGVIAVGGDSAAGQPFVVRLLGNAGGASVGVLSVAGPEAAPVESEGVANVRVRRSGGSEGDLSVTYRTVATGDATVGEDFTPTEGTLHWANGDRSVRNVAVEIAPDEGPAEGPETFQVALENFQGGAGIGTQSTTVTIQADGFPAGQFAIHLVGGYYEDPIFQFEVIRDFNYSGNVCVEVEPRSGTAIAGEDFKANSSSVCWGDQESGVKYVDIQIINDNVREGDETFTVELSNPTGGAVIGPFSSAVATIHANDGAATQPPPPSDDDDSGGGAAGPTGGGGAAGVPELLLGLVWLFARRRRLNYR